MRRLCALRRFLPLPRRLFSTIRQISSDSRSNPHKRGFIPTNLGSDLLSSALPLKHPASVFVEAFVEDFIGAGRVSKMATGIRAIDLKKLGAFY